MSDDSTVQVLEGTWEEVSRHSDELAGRRVRVVVLPEAQANGTGDVSPDKAEQQRLKKAFREWLKEVEETEARPVATPPTEFEHILIEKYRKQGLEF